MALLAGKSPRRFALDEAQLKAIKDRAGAGTLPNPYRSGFYHYLIESLNALGVDQPHPIKEVISRVRRLANAPCTRRHGRSLWRRWKNKQVETPWQARFLQNVEVLQRVPKPGKKARSCYGLKLLQIGPAVLGTAGVVIDILRDERGKPLLRLNTNASQPINEFRTRREDSHKATVAKFRQQRHAVQNGTCAICGLKRRLVVDHCHKQQHLRGLLCYRCNSGLGFFDDSPARLLQAALYLMQTGNKKEEASHAR